MTETKPMLVALLPGDAKGLIAMARALDKAMEEQGIKPEIVNLIAKRTVELMDSEFEP